MGRAAVLLAPVVASHSSAISQEIGKSESHVIDLLSIFSGF